jgi:formate hydrogenlyase transcriptional activator
MKVADFDLDLAETFELAIEASPNSILVVDPQGTIVLVNRELERQFGYAREELVGQTVDVLIPEAQRHVHAVHRQAFARMPESRQMGAGRELFGRRKDGSQIPVEIGLNPIPTRDGLFVLASIVNVAERRRSEEAQRATLAEQLDFERVVAELSSQFINLPAGQVNEAIRSGLRRTCEKLGLDRSTFYRLGPDGVLVDPVSWTAPEIQPLDAPVPLKRRFPWAIDRIVAGEMALFSTVAEIPNEIDQDACRALQIKAAVAMPLLVDGRVAGVLSFDAIQTERPWPPEAVHRLRVIASVFGQVLARQLRDQVIRAATVEARRLKDELQVENVSLRREARERLGLTRVVGRSTAVLRVLEQIEQVAATDSTVLLLGETGTGKELFATQIHELGARHGRAMVRVNCAAIPATLIESELFGREKGAFTGALSQQMGRFELANHSTIFLDEVGDLPPDVQVKLLRVLEERQIERLGSPRPITVDTRIVAATHRNLEQRVSEGLFREDLYYRLSVFPIHIPPLRERVEDIPLLVWHFVDEFSKAFGKRIESIDKDSLAALQRYPWPGNIRELRNVVERAMIGATQKRLTIAVPLPSAAAARRSSRLVDVETEHIRDVLESTGWRIRGRGGAAERLGLKPTTLETRLAKLGLRRPGHA